MQTGIETRQVFDLQVFDLQVFDLQVFDLPERLIEVTGARP